METGLFLPSPVLTSETRRLRITALRAVMMASILGYIQIIGAIAQFERELIIERTKAGLEEAKRKDVVLGRKPGLSKEAILKAEAASNLYKTGMDVLQICKIIQISPGTFYRYLRYTKTQFRTK